MNYDQFLQTDYSKGLNSGQLEVFRVFLDSKDNIALNGPAGTGKSHVIKKLCQFCEDNDILINRTASTGIAAVNIGAQTLHSFLGLGIGNETGEVLFKRVRKNKRAVERIRGCKILLIDELSMVSGETLDKIYSIFDFFGRQPRYIFVQDFLQLSPVFKEDKKYAFESASWKRINPRNIILNEIVRQDKESEFAKFLNEIRVGNKRNLSFLEPLVIKESEIPEGSMVCFSKNIDVDQYNNERLLKLKGDLKSFYSNDSGEEPHLSNLRKNCMAPEILKLKIGAQVMLLKNLSDELVNGSIGIVTKFSENQVTVDFSGIEEVLGKEDWKIEESFLKDNGKVKTRVLASRSQIPLKLAWASTLHKVQGLTCDKITLDLSSCFAPGQSYCGLSRARTVEGLRIIGFRPSSIKVDDRPLDFYRNLGMEI